MRRWAQAPVVLVVVAAIAMLILAVAADQSMHLERVYDTRSKRTGFARPRPRPDAEAGALPRKLSAGSADVKRRGLAAVADPGVVECPSALAAAQVRGELG